MTESITDAVAENRLKAVHIENYLLDMMVLEGNTGVWSMENGLPEDAVCVRSFDEPSLQCRVLIYAHPSFEVVPRNQHVPMYLPCPRFNSHNYAIKCVYEALGEALSTLEDGPDIDTTAFVGNVIKLMESEFKGVLNG